MAQSNAVQEQPSMEDILTSIRRIIDDGNATPNAPTLPSVEEIANDDVVTATPIEPVVVEEVGQPEPIDASIAMIDEAIAVSAATERHSSKYESRFSDDDRTAFAEVGNVLAGTTEAPDREIVADSLVSEPARMRVGGSLNDLSDALASEARRELPHMTEAMLKPMLSDWLDNNLPSMVERLVREEIERIARGE
ncbi:hypothetical protein GQR58_018041 [Nymphon striatum]|nr:hypothetical protein GQR58_018041 [Nymphon striatum]